MARKTAAGTGKQKARPKTRRPLSAKPGERAGAESSAAAPQAATRAAARPYAIVGVGASAGGFEAFRELLKALPADTGLGFVLIQHLDPGHESMLTKLLSKATVMPVAEVQEGMTVEPDHVYIIPPNTTLEIRGGTLHLTARQEMLTKHLPIDYFLRSLAEDQGSRSIGVILSGTASDGTLGLKAIKAEGGITFAQDELSAKYDGMPHSAVAAGCVDFILPPEGIAQELARVGRHPYLGMAPPVQAAEPPAEGAVESDDDLRKIFSVLQRATGVNFTYYKYSTIKRRIARRMVLHKLESLEQYLKFLLANPSEPEALCEDILIHVTSFFREHEAFQALAEWVFPRVVSNKPAGEAIRVWVPGCSTGEEVYSIAIVLLECLGDRASATPIQIFGTDISEVSIERARAGVYTEGSLVEISPDRLRRFFVKVEGGYQITKSVREMCIFARQDLGKDPPFSRLDLISCRNVLIYMGPVLQKKVMAIFHYALKPSGFLVLGKSESIGSFADLFTVADRKYKIFSRRPVAPRAVFDVSADGYEKAIMEGAKKPEAPAHFDLQKEVDRIVLGQYAPAGLVVNESLHILQFRGQSSPYLSPPPGEASLSLLRMVRPELALDLRTAVHRARKQEIPVGKEGIRIERNGHPWDVSLEVIPIQGPPGERYFLVLFQERPGREPAAVAATPGQHARSVKRQTLELGRLRREVQTTKEYLQSIIEEQEATNEELKSANEEALSSNEELQSTNEELETAKEELQSTNEELVTVNEQIQNRNAELAQLTDDLANLLGGVNIPILMLDNDRRIRRFTPQAEKLLNLVSSDVGRPIDNIRPNLDAPDLGKLVSEVLESMSVREQEIQDREGRWYSMRVRPYRTLDNKIYGVVMIFVDVDALKRAQLDLEHEQSFTAAVLESAGALVLVTDPQGRVVQFNLACQRLSGYSADEMLGKEIFRAELSPPEDAIALREVYREMLETHAPREHESHWVDRNGQRHLIAWSNTLIADAHGVIEYVSRIGVDITERRRAEEALRQSESALRESEAQLRTLTAGLLTAQEEERRRVSQELHDDISQRMAALAIGAETLQKGLPASQEELRGKLQEFRERLETLSEDLRRTARDLHPFTLTHLGLAAALRSYCEEFSQQRQIRVRLSQRNLPEKLPEDVALCLYRVVQEALGNIARHARAGRAVISLVHRGDALHVSITDDGHGFDPEKAKGKGLGLISIEERVRHVGGTVSITVRPGDGTRIDIRVPLSVSAAAPAPEPSTS